jgi:tetratricopeptide (TPR) repeat protein
LAQITHLRSRYRTTADSIPLAQKALAYAQESGSAHLIARSQFQSGFLLLWHGDLNDAAAMLRQAMTTAAELGDPWLHIQCQVYQLILDRFQGNTIQVAAHLPEVLESSQELGYVNYVGVGEANSAWLYYRAGEWQQAQAQAQAALASWAKTRYPFQWLAHWPLLTLFLRQNQPLDAIVQARAMLDPGQQQMPDDVHDVLETAVAAWEASTESAAQSQLQAAVELASQRGYI